MYRKVTTVCLAVGVGLIVTVGGLFAVGVLGIPDAGLEDNSWGAVSDEEIEVITTVWLDNPNPGLEPDELTVEYALAMNGVDLADGSAADVAVPSGNTTTELRTDLRYDRLPAWWVSHVRNGEVSDLQVGVTAHAALGPLEGSPSHTYEDDKRTELEPMIADAVAGQEGEHSLSPVSLGSGPQRQLVEPTVEIRETEAEWGTVTDERTELHLSVDVHNPNAYPLPTPALTGEMEFNNRSVAEWKATEVELLDGTYDETIPPQRSREITFVVVLDNDDVVDWFATHVDNEEVTDAEVRAQFAMNVNGETVTIPEDEAAINCEYDLRTDIFVDQSAGLDRNSCEIVPWASPDDEAFEELGATLEVPVDDPPSID
ncbi:Water stress and hypersensitive response domain-containing protein [Halopiger djelfimassiliensis]|uniref:Water stress and hypersensitive response domain-containing protein n=1 Tax=Halopiger djelfimassiliensis TaxID=1293047 RepID=UPI0006782BE1|nr:Water stress and hypersensitive response domain-containing protein [Halopiger djelfimassiliensis]